jgi:hypothetical protein
MAHHQAVQLMGQGKYYMIIFYRKQFLHAGFYPLLLFYGSAVGAMPVSATVVLVFYMAALFVTALVHMIAKRCSTTGFYALQYFSYMSIFIPWQCLLL